jgi:hypothetical protein
MKKVIIYVILVALPLIGKGRLDDEKNVIIRDHFHYFIKEVDHLMVEIDFKMGELDLLPNKDNPTEFEGFSEYSPIHFKSPDVYYSVIGKSGQLDIHTNPRDHSEENSFSFSWNKEQFHNKNEFKLPLNLSTDVELDFGMGKANLDLSKIQISSLNIECGMGSVELEINDLNKIQCEIVIIETGMGEFSSCGLSNLNAEIVNIEVGMGAAELDFSDPISRDMEIVLEVGLGSIELVLPDNVNISAKVHDHFLSTIELNGLVKKRNKYVSEHWDNTQPTVTLDMSVGLGSIELKIAD